MTRTSIIIVNYNQLMLISECLHSLQPTLSQTDEVIVVDNHSTDGSVEHLTESFPWVKLVPSTNNLGFGGGNNQGAQHAKGKYLAFINPDTIVEPAWLAPLIETLESDPTVGIVTPKILLKQDPARINTCGNDIHLTGLTLCRGMNKPRPSFAEKTPVSAISGAAFVVEKHWFEKLGGFDEPFMMYMEETDLSIRSRLAGRGCLYDPNAVVHHAYELRFGPEKTYYQERNRYWMLLKNFRFATLILLIPSLIIAEVVTWGFVLLKDRRRWKNKFKAYGWMLKHWKRIMESRQQAQALRQVKDRDLILAHAYKLDFEQTQTGTIAMMAHLVFDTFFFVSYYILYALIWW